MMTTCWILLSLASVPVGAGVGVGAALCPGDGAFGPGDGRWPEGVGCEVWEPEGGAGDDEPPPPHAASGNVAKANAGKDMARLKKSTSVSDELGASATFRTSLRGARTVEP